MKHAVLSLLLLALAFVGGPHSAWADTMPGPHAAMTADVDCAGCPDGAAGDGMAHMVDGCASMIACALFILPASDEFAFVVDLVGREPVRRTALRVDTPDIPRILPPPRA